MSLSEEIAPAFRQEMTGTIFTCKHLILYFVRDMYCTQLSYLKWQKVFFQIMHMQKKLHAVFRTTHPDYVTAKATRGCWIFSVPSCAAAGELELSGGKNNVVQG